MNAARAATTDLACSSPSAEPAKSCALCPRLARFRTENVVAFQSYYNGPAPSFGALNSRVLIVGLAPGLHGANRTGRPFTGDYAGDLLYGTLLKFGFAAGAYGARPDDGLMLVDAMITNAVRCVPPENKPTPEEIRTCRPFLLARIESLRNLQAIVCLGRIAHESTLAALGVKAKAAPFGHGAVHDAAPGLKLFDSYHCSRYNTNTGRLTSLMFEHVFASVRAHLSGAAS